MIDPDPLPAGGTAQNDWYGMVQDRNKTLLHCELAIGIAGQLAMAEACMADWPRWRSDRVCNLFFLLLCEKVVFCN